jgi:hypothetical protein
VGGQVVAVDPMATQTSGQTTYPVTVALAGPPPGWLHRGVTATVTVVVAATRPDDGAHT